MKIGFIYYSFFPVTGGASVHGYNLAKELHKFGYQLYKLNGDPDPYTRKLTNPIKGLVWILANCDLIYIRMDYFLNLRNLISLLALISQKKVIVEINSPSDELHLFGRGEKYIRSVDRIMKKILKKTDAVITVSKPLKNYCSRALNLDNVHVIENGSEVFDINENAISDWVRTALSEIKKNFPKIVVWSGSANNMQDLSKLGKIADSQTGKTAIILIVKDEFRKSDLPETRDNIFIFRNLPRDDVKYIVSSADIGLALYREYPWSRWGFYNSSLKIFEYLNNGLLTITNTKGSDIQQSYPNFRFAEDVHKMIDFIDTYTSQGFEIDATRTWSDVAQETSVIIQEVAEGC